MKKKQHPGDRIKKIRTDYGHSQAKMATIIGTFQANYSLIERGIQQITYSQLTALHEYSGVNLHWIITGEGSVYIGKDGTVDSKLDKIIAMLQKNTSAPDQAKPGKQKK